ncbi:MAG: carboxypeptidase-like regulatory domain-containing protein, partial [Gammaproteobacteria bacterium]
LPVGDYSLEARKEGFKAAVQSGIRIDVNSSPVIDLRLDVGSVTERIDVTAAAPVIDTESQAIGNSRYETQLRNLPIIVREVQALVGQTAGVPYGTTDTVGGNFQQGGRSAMQVLADGAQLNPFQTTAWPAIDGIGRRADLTIPGIDAIQEVKWITNGGSAEYAQPTQVIVASKAGTNELHGSLYEFYRSGGLGARRWEAAQRESFVRHQFEAASPENTAIRRRTSGPTPSPRTGRAFLVQVPWAPRSSRFAACPSKIFHRWATRSFQCRSASWPRSRRLPGRRPS